MVFGGGPVLAEVCRQSAEAGQRAGLADPVPGALVAGDRGLQVVGGVGDVLAELEQVELAWVAVTR